MCLFFGRTLSSLFLSPTSLLFSASLSFFLRQRRRNAGGSRVGSAVCKPRVASELLFTDFLGPCRPHFNALSSGPGPGPGPRLGGLGWEARQTRPAGLCPGRLPSRWPSPHSLCGWRRLCPRYVFFFFFSLTYNAI